MKIWQLSFDVDNFDNFIPEIELTATEVQSFDGRPKKINWTPIKVKRMEPEKGLLLGDAPGFTIPVFSKRALEFLYPIIGDSSEILPLLTDEGEFYGINVTAVVDVIDYAKSEYLTYNDGKRIMAFKKYAFVQNHVLMHHNIFKIVDEPTRRAYVSDKFKRVVEDNELTGFKFKLVWDSEEQIKLN